MQVWAINWHLYVLTHQAIALGMIGLFRVIPIVLFSLLGGAVADAWDRRRVMIVTQSVLALNALALGVLSLAHRIDAPLIYLLTLIGAGAMAFDNPARQSLLPLLVPRPLFTSALSLNSVIMRVATISGPLFAGVIIASGGIPFTYLINAVSFLAVIAALLAIRPHSGTAETGSQPSAVNLADSTPKVKVNAESLREGLRFVIQTPILVWTMALDFFATFFSSASALLPIFARDILHAGARGYGFLAAAEAVGALIAGITLSMSKPIRKQGITVIISVVMYGLATVLFGVSRLFVVSWCALLISGAADAVSTVMRQTIRQLTTPDALRGRMTAVNMVFFMGGPQLGELEAGLVAKWIGAPWSVITGGLGCLFAVTWVAVRSRTLREYTFADEGATVTAPTVA